MREGLSLSLYYFSFVLLRFPSEGLAYPLFTYAPETLSRTRVQSERYIIH